MQGTVLSFSSGTGLSGFYMEYENNASIRTKRYNWLKMHLYSVLGIKN